MLGAQRNCALLTSKTERAGGTAMDFLVASEKRPMIAASWWVTAKSNKKGANVELELTYIEGETSHAFETHFSCLLSTHIVRCVPAVATPVRPLCDTEPMTKAPMVHL